MEKEYLLRLNMSNFLGAYVKEMENESGIDEPYLCIPIKRNSFTLYPDRPVTLTFTPKKPDARFADFKAALSVFHLRRTYR